MFLSIQENIPLQFIKIGYHNFFSISYNIDIYHDINLPLMGKEMLSTCLLDRENEGKHNLNSTEDLPIFHFSLNYVFYF